MTLIETIRAALSGAGAGERGHAGLKAVPDTAAHGVGCENGEAAAEADAGNKFGQERVTNLDHPAEDQQPKTQVDGVSGRAPHEMHGSKPGGGAASVAHETQTDPGSTYQDRSPVVGTPQTQKSGPEVHEQAHRMAAPAKRSANGRFIEAATADARPPAKDAESFAARSRHKSKALGKSTGTFVGKANTKLKANSAADCRTIFKVVAVAFGNSDARNNAADGAGAKPKVKVGAPKITSATSLTAVVGSDAGRETGFMPSEAKAGTALGGDKLSETHELPNDAKSKPARKAAQTHASGPITKSDQVLNRLRDENGVSIADLIDLTGWQAHTVRGFLSATVRKRLALVIVSETGSYGIRRYRIADRGNGTDVDGEVR